MRMCSPRCILWPTIGIGSGPDCDGQILVTHDLIGLYPWFTPRHVRPRLDAASQVVASVRGWKAEDIAQLMNGNILRVMRRAEDVAKELAEKGH